MKPCVLNAPRGSGQVWFDIPAMVFAKTHENRCGSEADGLFAKRWGHLRCLDDVSVEAVVRVLEMTLL